MDVHSEWVPIVSYQIEIVVSLCLTQRLMKQWEDFLLILWPSGWARLHQHKSTGGTQHCLVPFLYLCLQENKLSLSGSVYRVLSSMTWFQITKSWQKLTSASAWWAQTLRGQLSASEIVCATVIPDIKGFLTYIQSPEQLPHPLPQRSLKPSACPEIDAEPQTVRSDFVVWNPNHTQLASETSGTNVTLLQQDIFVFDKY